MKWRITLVVACLLTLWPLSVRADWQLYEETNVKGTINGTVKKGRIIQMQSGSIYQVSDVTLQLVLELAPEALVLRDGKQFKLIIDGFDEPLICKQLVALPRSEPARSLANPPSTATTIKTADNVPLEQIMPEAQQREMGIHKLTPEERDRLRKYLIELYLLGVEQGRTGSVVRGITQDAKSASASVIESQIDGDFEGWEGETVVKLMNGQIWQQTEYYYHYHYAFMPDVLIYMSNGAYKMKVEGVDKSVGVTKIR